MIRDFINFITWNFYVEAKVFASTKPKFLTRLTCLHHCRRLLLHYHPIKCLRQRYPNYRSKPFMACRIILMKVSQYSVKVWTSDASKVGRRIPFLIQYLVYHEGINNDASETCGFHFFSRVSCVSRNRLIGVIHVVTSSSSGTYPSIVEMVHVSTKCTSFHRDTPKAYSLKASDS